MEETAPGDLPQFYPLILGGLLVVLPGIGFLMASLSSALLGSDDLRESGKRYHSGARGSRFCQMASSLKTPKSMWSVPFL